MSKRTNLPGRSVASGTVDLALDSFRRGEPVLIRDAADREGEGDLVYPA